jgi:hypothetical protein
MNKFGSLPKRCVIAASAALIAIAIPVPASAQAQTSKSQSCVITVTGVDANNNFITEPMKCYDTFAASLRSIGATVPDNVSPTTVNMSAVTATTSAIGIHYDASNGTGSALTVTGTGCTGGGLNVPIAWNDRISSTLNGCPTIQHFENTNYAGASLISYGSGSVTSFSGAYMDNRTSSIKYF